MVLVVDSSFHIKFGLNYGILNLGLIGFILICYILAWLIGLVFWLLIWKFWTRVYNIWDISIGLYLLIWVYFYWQNLLNQFENCFWVYWIWAWIILGFSYFWIFTFELFLFLHGPISLLALVFCRLSMNLWCMEGWILWKKRRHNKAVNGALNLL